MAAATPEIAGSSKGHLAAKWIALTAAIALVWLGMVIGVSFIATPVKFAAATLTRPVAFDVGGVTFALFSKIEWGVCAIFAMATLFTQPNRLKSAALVTIIAIVVLQGAWLLPELNARAAAIIAGKTPLPSLHHAVFAIAEVAKCLLLAGFAILNFVQLTRGNISTAR